MQCHQCGETGPPFFGGPRITRLQIGCEVAAVTIFKKVNIGFVPHSGKNMGFFVCLNGFHQNTHLRVLQKLRASRGYRHLLAMEAGLSSPIKLYRFSAQPTTCVKCWVLPHRHNLAAIFLR